MSSTLLAQAAEAHPAWFTFDGAASFTSGSESTATARTQASLSSLLPPSVAGGLRGVESRAADAAVLRLQPGTAHAVTLYGNQVTVAEISQKVQAFAFDGPSAWTGYALIAGHWYDTPGEVDVNTSFLDASGLSVGDTATVETGTAQVTVRIAGEVFAPSRQPRLYGASHTLPGLVSAQNFSQVDVGLRPGTSTTAYVQAVNARLGTNSPFAATQPSNGNFYAIASALIGLLALMVAIAAGLGVLNTVLMTTRDQVHDLGVFKALGMRPGQIVTMVTCWVAGCPATALHTE